MQTRIFLFIYFSLLQWIDLINRCAELLPLLYILFNKLYSELCGICLFLPFVSSFLVNLLFPASLAHVLMSTFFFFSQCWARALPLSHTPSPPLLFLPAWVLALPKGICNIVRVNLQYLKRD